MNSESKNETMSTTFQQAPSTLERGIRELFFVIRPPQHILSDVSVLKDDVHYLVGRALSDRYTPAYISLFRYSDDEERMHHMLRFAEARAAELEPFNVFLKDFGVFFNGNQRTIYLDIVNKAPVQEMFEKIVREDPDFIPHIPIARNISNQDFLRCWPYLKGLKYSNQYFHCDRITVLARKERKWEVYREILLANGRR
jgi:2'-5' RNA ligase